MGITRLAPAGPAAAATGCGYRGVLVGWTGSTRDAPVEWTGELCIDLEGAAAASIACPHGARGPTFAFARKATSSEAASAKRPCWACAPLGKEGVASCSA